MPTFRIRNERPVVQGCQCTDCPKHGSVKALLERLEVLERVVLRSRVDLGSRERERELRAEGL